MCPRMKDILHKLRREEGGQTLLIVLLLLLVGVILITATLALTSTSIKAGKAYKDNLMQFNAADAGMEEAVRAIKKRSMELGRPAQPLEVDYPSFYLNENSVDVSITGVSTDNMTHFVTSVATDNKTGKTTTITSLVQWRSNLFDYAVSTSDDEIDRAQNPVIIGPTYPGYVTPLPTEQQLKDYYRNTVPYPKVPTGDGDSLGTWTDSGGNSVYYDDIAETTPNDADYITGTTLSGGSARKLFTFSAFNIPSGASIQNLTIFYRVNKGGGGSPNIGASIKVNGIPYNIDPGVTPQNTIETKSYPYTTNPATPGLPWTVDDINGIGPNPLQAFGVSSTKLTPKVNVYMVYAQVSFLSGSIDIAGLPAIGPGYGNSDLNIINTGVDEAITRLDGTIYVEGNNALDIGTSGSPKTFVLNLNNNALFSEGSIYIGTKTTIIGTGAIVALGDVTFKPNLSSGNTTDFIFVMSLLGTVDFNPSGEFYGAVFGKIKVNLQPNYTITHTTPPPFESFPFPVWTIGGESVSLKYLNYIIRQS